MTVAAVGERYEVELHCTRCVRTTPHLVTSGPGGLSRVTCIACGRAVAVYTLQFMEQYLNSVTRRLLAKPFEITTEFTRNPREFIATLPGRMLTKPFRVAAELRATMDIMRRAGRARPTAPPTLPTVAGELPPVTRACRVLLSSPLLWAHPCDDVLRLAGDLGYDGVEFWAYQVLRDGTPPAALGARARELGLTLTLHTLSWDLNVTSTVEDIRRASLEALHRSVNLGAELDVDLVVMHPGRTTVPHDGGEVYWPRLVEAVREVADHAGGRGLVVGVEHMEARQAEYVVTAEDANRLVREVDRPNVGTVLDVAHIPWGEDEVAFIAQLEHVVHVHLSDTDESRLHLPLGEGSRDLARVLATLRGFTGGIALEGFSITPGTELARWNKAQFEELWREAAEPAAPRAAHPAINASPEGGL